MEIFVLLFGDLRLNNTRSKVKIWFVQPLLPNYTNVGLVSCCLNDRLTFRTRACQQ